MTTFDYTLDHDDPSTAPFGLIALQTDETIEPELTRYFADSAAPMYVSRVPSGLDVTPETLGSMKKALPLAASLLPAARKYSVVAYGCTSGSSVIGSDIVADLIRRSCPAAYVTDPLCATLACAASKGVSKCALLSPYIEEVNTTLRQAFANEGLSMDVFGSFNVREEASVVRISESSIVDAAISLGRDPSVEAVFISCTNLRTYDALSKIEARIEKLVMSSNQTLAWHMRYLSEQYQANSQ